MCLCSIHMFRPLAICLLNCVFGLLLFFYLLKYACVCSFAYDLFAYWFSACICKHSVHFMGLPPLLDVSTWAAARAPQPPCRQPYPLRAGPAAIGVSGPF